MTVLLLIDISRASHCRIVKPLLQTNAYLRISGITLMNCSPRIRSEFTSFRSLCCRLSSPWIGWLQGSCNILRSGKPWNLWAWTRHLAWMSFMTNYTRGSWSSLFLSWNWLTTTTRWKGLYPNTSPGLWPSYYANTKTVGISDFWCLTMLSTKLKILAKTFVLGMCYFFWIDLGNIYYEGYDFSGDPLFRILHLRSVQQWSCADQLGAV